MIQPNQQTPVLLSQASLDLEESGLFEEILVLAYESDTHIMVYAEATRLKDGKSVLVRYNVLTKEISIYDERFQYPAD